MASLVDALGARRGIVCAVGAGGKKSVLYALARSHPGRVALTTTVHTAVYPDSLAAEVVIDDSETLAQRLASWSGDRLCYATPSDKPARHGGVAPETIRAIHDAAGFDVTLVKADGARMRRIKAPSSSEPVLVPGAGTVLPVVSALAIGQPLGERIAHRVDRVAAIAGVAPGAIVTADVMARVLASPRGALRRVGQARVVPIINMVDDAGIEARAREAALAALALTERFDSVVLCCLRDTARPAFTIVRRGAT